MINLITDLISFTQPTNLDKETLSVIESIAKIKNVVNECITQFNNLEDKTNEDYKKFLSTIDSYKNVITQIMEGYKNQVFTIYNEYKETINNIKFINDYKTYVDEIYNQIRSISEEINTIINSSNITTKNDVAPLENKVFPMKINAFLTILNSVAKNTNKSNEQISKNIEDLSSAYVDGFCLVVEVMPSYDQKVAFSNSTITQDSLILKCYPEIDVINNWLNVANEKGLHFSEIKFHTLWAKENIKKLNVQTFMNTYNSVVLNTLDNLVIKPTHATIINEASSLITNDTMETIKQLLTTIKTKGYQTGLTGTTVPDELINYIDNYYIHTYPAVSSKKDSTTIQDITDGWNNSLIYEKILKRIIYEYPEKGIIIDEVGCSSYWESLASPEQWIGNKGYTWVSNGKPMALYAQGAIDYYSKIGVKEICIFWTDTLPEELQKVIKKYKGVI